VVNVVEVDVGRAEVKHVDKLVGQDLLDPAGTLADVRTYHHLDKLNAFL
jgi:hypothetical protein